MGKEPKVKAKAKPVPKGFSNTLDLQQMPSLLKAVWPDQEPLSLSAKFSLRDIFFLLWAFFFFIFFTQGLFSAFDFSIGIIVKSFHFCQMRDVNKNMRMT